MTELINYIVAVFFTLLATVMFNLTPILQKDAINKMNEFKLSNVWSSLKAMFSDKKWVIGMLLGIGGGIPYIIALDLVGITVVQPIINVGFLILVYAAYKYLHEKITPLTIFAIILMILMPISIALGNVSEPTRDITTSAVQLYLLLFTLIMMIIVGVLLIMTKKFPIFWTAITGILFSLGAIYSQAALSFIYFANYNLLGNFDAIIANLFINPYLRLMLIVGIISLAFNMIASYVEQMGLQRIPASKFTPVNQTVDNLIAIIAGLIIFGQILGSVPFYFIGVIMALSGSIILGKYQISQKPEDKISPSSGTTELEIQITPEDDI